MISILAVGDAGAATPMRDTIAGFIGGSDAVLLLGDNFYDYGIESETDPRWRSDFEDAFRPKCPWYAILGNHDYLGDPDAQVRRNGIGGWRMPARYYDEKIFYNENDGVHIFFLDTFELSPTESLLNSIGMGMPAVKWMSLLASMNAAKQLQWLEKGLAQSQMRWKVVAGHYPIFSNGGHGDNQELIRSLVPLFEKYGVDFYVCGHDHQLSHLNRNGTQYIISGTGCRLSKSQPSAEYSIISRKIGVAYFHFFPTHAVFGFMDHEPFFARTSIPNRTNPLFIQTIIGREKII